MRLALLSFGLAASVALPLCAAVHEAKSARELLVLDGDQTGNTIKVADGYLPESYDVATAIYAKGRPTFVLPPFYRVAPDGEGWWTVGRKRSPLVFEWIGAGKNDKWSTPSNWRVSSLASSVNNTLVPSRLDTVKLTKDAMIDLGCDRMVSNIAFTAKVILAGGAVHAQNTVGRGANAKLGVRAWSLLGHVGCSEGAVVAPLRGVAGYRGVLEKDESGLTRVVPTRPPAEFVWTGAAKDGKWFNEKNWQANGRPAVEMPSRIDRVVFGRKERKDCKEVLAIELPEGLTVVSNLVTNCEIVWKSAKSTDILGDGGGGSFIDILDISGNDSFTVRGNVRVCIKGGAENTEIIAEKNTSLAVAAHNGKHYKSITLEDNVEFIPYDWVVEVDRLVFKGRNKVRFWPPRKFNRFRPVWMVHAKHLEGDPEIFSDDMAHWGGHVEKWNDGSSMLEIYFK